MALAIAVSLSACGASRFRAASTSPSPSPSTTRPTAPHISTIDVAGRSLIIDGPQGFCVDRQNSQTGGDTAFVLLGNCAVVSPHTRAETPEIKALLTASVSNTDQTGGLVARSSVDMDRFFRSETGRTALSRVSDPGTVSVLDTFQQNNTFYVRARDTSPGIVPDAADDYWRAYFDLDGQLVSVSVIGFQADPLTPEKGLSTAQEFAGLIKQRNGGSISQLIPVATEIVPPQQTATETQIQPRVVPKPPSSRLSGVGLLRKLFN